MKLPAGANGFLLIKKRPGRIPPFWRIVDAGAGVRVSPFMERQWALVLASRNIPFQTVSHGGREIFYVPALYERLAGEELRAYSAEAADFPLPRPPGRVDAPLSLLFFAAFIIWQSFVGGWWIEGAPQFFAKAGSLDMARVRIWHEWYRVATALTLHSDAGHFLGNMAFGAVFMFFLARRAGVALAIAFSLLGGMMGNALNVFFRTGYIVSLGYSTALFASIGALSGIMAFDESVKERGKALAPLAAAGALLAMLGTGTERTDYLAHIFGLSSGFFLGFISGIKPVALFLKARGARRMLALSLFLLIISWVLALYKAIQG